MTDLIFEVIERERALEGEPVTEANACLPVEDDAGAPSVAAATALAGLISVDALDGVPLFYERGLTHPEHRHFSFDPTFRDECVAVIRSVVHRVPGSYGALKRITTAGTFVNKPGQHGLGRAMDHDRWHFEHVVINPIEHDHVASKLAVRRRYWALAAIMRSHSAFLLHGHYNAAHADHLHHDSGGAFGFDTQSEATVKLVQAICKHIHDKPALTIDGDYGPKSRAAVTEAMQRLHLPDDIEDPSTFKRFLLRSGSLGFQLAPA